MKNKPWSAMLACASALVGRRGKKAKSKGPPTGGGSPMSWLRELTAKTIRRRQTTVRRKGGWLIPQHATGHIRRARYHPTSKYQPHQGAQECARRRRQLGLGEYEPGRVAA